MKDIQSKITETIFEKVSMFPDKTQLAIAILKNGNTNYYGFIKEKNNLRKVQNENKIFEVGSITKVFTATVLADLVIKNKLELDSDIQQYFDFPFKDNTKISLLSLANHTSGLRSHPTNFDTSIENLINFYKDYDEDMMNDYLEHSLQLTTESENRYEYSNFGAGLLGHTLELSQKQTFKEMLQQKVFDKYKMLNTYMDRSNLKNELIIGLDENGTETENWDFNILFGAGGVLSSVSDLSKFVSAHFVESNKDLALTRQATYTVDDEMKVGLGWHIIKVSDDTEVYWHNGGTGGYKSSIVLDIKMNSAAIILSNISVFNPNHMNIDSLCANLSSILNEIN